MPYNLEPLPYPTDALEPYIDARTMEIHHDFHHGGYVNNLNAALASYPDLQSKSLEELIRELNTLPEEVRNAVRNNGGGKLEVMSRPNQDCPWSEGHYPIMCNDVWEHAYYLTYEPIPLFKKPLLLFVKCA
ncbi:superoxide dismutase [Nostoc sp.]|uniref:superoxide dismutase n=1 Tax=Nostoc sp. TaxID=1180 RepID=UPI003FA54FF9